MRILHVNRFLYHQWDAESYLLALADLQRGRGERVAFFAARHPDNIAVPYEEHFPKYIPTDPLPRGPVGRLRGTGRMLWSSSARRGIGKVIEDFRPDVAHVHAIYHQLSPSVLSALRAARVPTVMTVHDYRPACLQEPGRRNGMPDAGLAVSLETWLHRRLRAYEPVRRFICPSRFLAERLTRAGAQPGRVRVLDHFADGAGPPPKTEAGGPLVCVGRLGPEKGFDVAITAMGMLRGIGELVIVGDGPARSALERMADEVAPGRVRVAGRLPQPEMSELIRSATALVVPSRSPENQPLAILRAFACGVPVIGTALGGVPELIVDGATGRLIPPDDPLLLSSAMLALLQNPREALAMGLACREVARRRFSAEGHLTALREVYSEAIKEGG
ncbi:hypothetical protein C1I98_33630 [Spongiactinospora gelatinilytica]|uniref:Glycosyltransferase subfamily 4-like N-terminal domain-containing protein n=1 Tax=Spongiactinospora gelatinilytica TaxID=2666298 RepID=A0A2W2FEG9_9ACTN|nr:glycosyltransferase family 4 protein [Spongiactinospora gelatinilytica]PZG26945.1 hypothetical protein C1I98_33630 [Spongiactinospora gelatinilytica]